MLGFIVNAHSIYECLVADPRQAHHEHGEAASKAVA
jgi:hypothetical protein